MCLHVLASTNYVEVVDPDTHWTPRGKTFPHVSLFSAPIMPRTRRSILMDTPAYETK